MKFFLADAFAEQPFGGNPAGVALVDAFPPEAVMQAIDAELKLSETAFVQKLDEKSFRLRYFTPTEEVPLCGHATIAAFSCLRDAGLLAPGDYRLETLAGSLGVSVSPESIFMDMAKPWLLGTFSPEAQSELYEALGLSPEDKPEDIEPRIVSTGLADIMLPVKSSDILNSLRPDMARIAELSRTHDILSFHVFCPGRDGYLAECRDLAPVCGIPEEAATGTANAALSHYLFTLGMAEAKKEHKILQGEAMGRPSVIRTRLAPDGSVRVGGGAVTLFAGELHL